MPHTISMKAPIVRNTGILKEYEFRDTLNLAKTPEGSVAATNVTNGWRLQAHTTTGIFFIGTEFKFEHIQRIYMVKVRKRVRDKSNKHSNLKRIKL